MLESTCPHKWDFKSYGTCPMCLEDMQSRHSPNYITTEMLKRIEHLSYTVDLPSRYVRMMASELLSLRQQIAQVQAQQEPAQAVEQPRAWPTGEIRLVDRADGCRGHYAIGRKHKSGYVEYWNLRANCWASCSDDVLTLEQAQALMHSMSPSVAPAQAVPVAWKHDCAALLTNDVELWIDQCPHCGKPRTPTVEPALFNTCLSNAKQEPAQSAAEPVGYISGWINGHLAIRLLDPALALSTGTALFLQPPTVPPAISEPAQVVPAFWASENIFKDSLRDNIACILTTTKCAANTVPLYTHPVEQQAVPVAWTDDDYTKIIVSSDIAGAEAANIPLYTHSAPLDSDTRKMVLELCKAVQEHVAVWTYPYGKQTLELAKQIRERLEAGDGKN